MKGSTECGTLITFAIVIASAFDNTGVTGAENAEVVDHRLLSNLHVELGTEHERDSETERPELHPYLLFLYAVMERLSQEEHSDICQTCMSSVAVRTIKQSDIQTPLGMRSVYHLPLLPKSNEHVQIVLSFRRRARHFLRPNDTIRIIGLMNTAYGGELDETEIGSCGDISQFQHHIVCDLNYTARSARYMRISIVGRDKIEKQNLHDIIHMGDTSPHSPVLVCFSNFEDNEFKTLKHETKTILKRMYLRKMRQNIRRNNRHLHESSSRQEFGHPEQGVCRLVPWEIDLISMGWGSWVIHPRRYYANFCGGQCMHPMSARHLNTTKHAYVKGLYKAYHGIHLTSHIPAAHCSPIEYKSIRMLTIDFKGCGEVTTVPNMVVTRCGCT